MRFGDSFSRLAELNFVSSLSSAEIKRGSDKTRPVVRGVNFEPTR